ncbi:hypothetical protein Mapa_013940 [Marchantia paleacea]|nr:hypothetical protein Mapa_013940 [Marchantia paleacea]
MVVTWGATTWILAGGAQRGFKQGVELERISSIPIDERRESGVGSQTQRWGFASDETIGSQSARAGACSCHGDAAARPSARFLAPRTQPRNTSLGARSLAGSPSLPISLFLGAGAGASVLPLQQRWLARWLGVVWTLGPGAWLDAGSIDLGRVPPGVVACLPKLAVASVPGPRLLVCCSGARTHRAAREVAACCLSVTRTTRRLFAAVKRIAREKSFWELRRTGVELATWREGQRRAEGVELQAELRETRGEWDGLGGEAGWAGKRSEGNGRQGKGSEGQLRTGLDSSLLLGVPGNELVRRGRMVE